MGQVVEVGCDEPQPESMRANRWAFRAATLRDFKRPNWTQPRQAFNFSYLTPPQNSQDVNFSKEIRLI